jgi:hypothetical protein
MPAAVFPSLKRNTKVWDFKNAYAFQVFKSRSFGGGFFVPVLLFETV